MVPDTMDGPTRVRKHLEGKTRSAPGHGEGLRRRPLMPLSGAWRRSTEAFHHLSGPLEELPALGLLARYAHQPGSARHYAPGEVVPLDGVVPGEAREEQPNGNWR